MEPANHHHSVASSSSSTSSSLAESYDKLPWRDLVSIAGIIPSNDGSADYEHNDYPSCNEHLFDAHDIMRLWSENYHSRVLILTETTLTSSTCNIILQFMPYVYRLEVYNVCSAFKWAMLLTLSRKLSNGVAMYIDIADLGGHVTSTIAAIVRETTTLTSLSIMYHSRMHEESDQEDDPDGIDSTPDTTQTLDPILREVASNTSLTSLKILDDYYDGYSRDPDVGEEEETRFDEDTLRIILSPHRAWVELAFDGFRFVDETVELLAEYVEKSTSITSLFLSGTLPSVDSAVRLAYAVKSCASLKWFCNVMEITRSVQVDYTSSEALIRCQLPLIARYRGLLVESPRVLIPKYFTEFIQHAADPTANVTAIRLSEFDFTEFDESAQDERTGLRIDTSAYPYAQIMLGDQPSIASSITFAFLLLRHSIETLVLDECQFGGWQFMQFYETFALGKYLDLVQVDRPIGVFICRGRVYTGIDSASASFVAESIASGAARLHTLSLSVQSLDNSCRDLMLAFGSAKCPPWLHNVRIEFMIGADGISLIDAAHRTAEFLDSVSKNPNIKRAELDGAAFSPDVVAAIVRICNQNTLEVLRVSFLTSSRSGLYPQVWDYAHQMKWFDQIREAIQKNTSLKSIRLYCMPFVVRYDWFSVDRRFYAPLDRFPEMARRQTHRLDFGADMEY